jgi:uncharacterized protein YndB with AHSA1/START domain
MAIADPTALSLELSRRFDAPPERVFDAWLGKHWGEWLPPRDAQCAVVELDPRVGGGFRLQMTMSDGREIEVSGTYQEIRRPQRLAFSWNAEYANQQMMIALTFRPDGSGTMMTLHQTGFPNADLHAGYSAGWSGSGGSFDKLAQVLARTAT